jgi:hypothetical protein
VPPIVQRPLLPLRTNRLTPFHLQLSEPFRNPMQSLLEFNAFANGVRGWTIVWGHGPEDTQH